ncbi:PIN domain-containing protein [Candidatus Woesearchaeota archaeon]|nr:PIN domain-containing protein [Candidatus Woesearchaeota archaeon]
MVWKEECSGESEMKRLMLDTNIFGLLVSDKDFHMMHSILENNKEELRIYGLNLIRQELKMAPRTIIAGVNVQASLLRAYSSFTTSEYVIDEKLKIIAEEYFKMYSKLGGGYTKEKLWNDFLIVACASVKDISVVVSEDNATMLNEIAQKSYQIINQKEGLKLPDFIGYKLFKKE